MLKLNHFLSKLSGSVRQPGATDSLNLMKKILKRTKKRYMKRTLKIKMNVTMKRTLKMKTITLKIAVIIG